MHKARETNIQEGPSLHGETIHASPRPTVLEQMTQGTIFPGGVQPSSDTGSFSIFYIHIQIYINQFNTFYCMSSDLIANK